MPTLLNHSANSMIHYPLRKRSRLSIRSSPPQVQQSINDLPDECLFEILRRVSGPRERSTSACVSKRWLALLSSIRVSELPVVASSSAKKALPDLNVAAEEDEDTDTNCGFLTRSLDGKDATDIRLAAIAVGTAGRGGLGKLSIRSGRVTDIGLCAIARGCPSLKSLSIWNLGLVTDRGLIEVVSSCSMLEKLDISHCPKITDKSLVAVAEKCPNLSSLTVEACSGIGNQGIYAIGRCSKIDTVTIKDCRLVSDKGIAGLMSSGSSTIERISLNGLNVSDLSLACIGHYGKAVTSLNLSGLQNVAERGFWVMGNALGLQKLRSLVITGCRGVTDFGLEAIAKGCPSLNKLRISKSSGVSDLGLKAFSEKALALEQLQLEECSRITLVGVLTSLIICSGRLKTLSLVKCLGIKDIAHFPQSLPVCASLRSLTIRDCPQFTTSSLSVVARICPNLVQLDLSGLVGVTDAGLLPLAESSNAGLVKVNLKGCINLTDAVVSTLVRVHGGSLKELNLDGCNKLTDKVLLAVAESCEMLEELDMSNAAITDYGVAALASARHLNVQLLSLANCFMLTAKIVPLLSNMGKSLTGINLKNCNRISEYGITSLEDKMYWCDILF